MSFKYIIPAVALSIALSACSEDKSLTSGEGETLVTVNGTPLKESLIAPQFAQIPPQMIAGREGDIKQQLLARLIEQEVVRQEAVRLNVMELDAYKNQLATFENQLKINTLMQQKVQEAVTAEALKAAYEKTKAQFAYPAVRARHILVKTEKEARALLKVVNAQNFADMAKEKSQGPSAPQGGDLGYFKKEAMVPEFAEVAFSTAKGKIANKPVKTQFGWHVVFVEDKQDAFVPPLTQVEPQLRQQLSQTVLQGYMQELKSKAKIEFADALTAKAEQSETPAEPAPAAGK